MKIAYVLTEDIDKHPGLRNKISGQIDMWMQQGHDVKLISHLKETVSDGHKVIACQSPGIKRRDYDAILLKYRLYRLFLLRRQYSFLKRAFSKIEPDLTYCRYAFPFFGLRAAYKKGRPYIVEINSDDVYEYYIKYKTTGIYNQLFRNGFFSDAAGLLFVTNELANASSFTAFEAERRVLANSVDCKNYPFLPSLKNEIPHICFIGTPNQKWHGLRKIGILAKALPDCRLHIIGPSKEECCQSGIGLFNNMVFHGYLQDYEAKQLVSKMDVGISTLSLYKKNMNEACPLKTRHYLAQGIPVIGGYSDTDISNQPFYLEIPNRRDNVETSISQIIAFVKNAFHNSELRKQAREFAEKHLDIYGQRKRKIVVF